MYQAFALAFLLAAVLNFVNFKWLKLPSSIGNMILALVSALVLIATKDLVPEVYNYTCALILEIDFSVLLLDVMLSILLFAGAMHVDLSLLEEELLKKEKDFSKIYKISSYFISLTRIKVIKLFLILELLKF